MPTGAMLVRLASASAKTDAIILIYSIVELLKSVYDCGTPDSKSYVLLDFQPCIF